MNKEKGYLVTKISDRKEKEYSFYKELKVNENNNPLEEDLDILVSIEENDRNVALFIGDDNITMFSFKSISKFNRKVINEYIDSYEEKVYNTVYWYTTAKNADFIKSTVEDIKEEFYKKAISERNNSYVRK